MPVLVEEPLGSVAPLGSLVPLAEAWLTLGALALALALAPPEAAATLLLPVFDDVLELAPPDAEPAFFCCATPLVEPDAAAGAAVD